MLFIETCPQCGAKLFETVICTYPPIRRKECLRCGWSCESETGCTKQIVFKEDSATFPTQSIKDEEFQELQIKLLDLGYGKCCVGNIGGLNSSTTANKDINIVYCKDCKHYHTEDCAMDFPHFPKTGENDFCSFGERKGNRGPLA